MEHHHHQHHPAIFFSAAAALLLVLLPLSAGAAAAPAPLLAKSACDTSCGNISVWYPFGIGPSYCYHSPGFNLTCDRSSNPPRLLLGDGTLEVSQLYNSQVEVVYTGELNGTLGGGLSDSGPYTVSDVNSFILVGCNARATLRNGDMIMSSCASLCQNGDDSYIPSFRESRMRCSGLGCCQAPIVVNREVLAGSGQLVPITSYDVELESFGWNRSDGPARVIVASNGWFDALSGSRQKKHSIQAPFVLQWEIIVDSHYNGTQGVQSSAGCARACRSNHTICTQGQRGGYLCSCTRGYQGNPYTTNGCQDIDECKRSEHYGCFGQCTNTVGSFQCHCQQGTSGDPTTRGGCFSFLIGASATNCSTSCGNMSVPYPFGIGPPKCYLPGFNLTCDTSRDPPQLMLGTLRVVDISLPNNTLRVINTDQLLLQVCGARIGMTLTHLWMGHGDTVPYSLSTNNELIVTGCSVQAGLSVGDRNRSILGGCSSFCSANENGTFDATSAAGIDDDYCYGMGCCQARISMSKNGMPSEFWFKSLQICASDNEYPDAYTFIAEEGWFNKRRVFSQLPRSSWRENQGAILEVPLGLDWEVLQLQPSGLGLKTNGSSQQYIKCPGICRSKNSLCKPRIRGYSCHCNTGYDGNPYLVDGCKGGGRRKFKGMSIIIGIAAGSGLVLLFLTGMLIKKKLKHRRSQMLKRKFFQQNRGQLLQQLVSQSAGIAERMIITLDELEKATRCFDKDLIVGGGGHGIVYKGILSNQHIVAIKKPKKVIQKEIDGFINEVAILSQINHRNVVKLYGCCLETEVPMLVYEFISNGTLYEHLHVEGPKSLSWNDRLRIATEAAKSLAYLHSDASIPIVHRDVKSANILLDDTLTAKVADFGASRCIPMDISGVMTIAQGTRGYWDPMYFYTGRLTEKSDVYSFGVVLVELLTRKKPFLYLSSDDESLVAHFVTLFEKGQLMQILDPQVMDEGGEKVEEVATIAVACVKLRGEDRPTMRQVELALNGAHVSTEESSDNIYPATRGESNAEGSTRRYSMEHEFILSAEYPR